MPSPWDASLLTLSGHRVQHTLIRARFSPAFSTGQRYIYAGSACGHWYLWDLAGEDPSTPVEGQLGHSDTVRDVSWHPWLPVLASSSFDGRQLIWSPPVSKDQSLSQPPQQQQSPTPVESSDEEGEGRDTFEAETRRAFHKIYVGHDWHPAH